MFSGGPKPLSSISAVLYCQYCCIHNRYHLLKQLFPSVLSSNFFSCCNNITHVHDNTGIGRGYDKLQKSYLSYVIFHQNLHAERNLYTELDDSSSSVCHLVSTNNSTIKDATMIQNLMKAHESHSVLESALAQQEILVSKELVCEVLRRHHSQWKLSLFFFNWAQSKQGYSHDSHAYNQMLDILGKMKQFKLMRQLVESIPYEKRATLVTERTFEVLLNRLAGGHKVEEAIDMFYKRKDFGLKLDNVAFQTLLRSLCRYKHVEVAESLFYLKKNEFPPDVKSRNIILNGWCVAGRIFEAKRFWNDIITSGCKPDLFTYGIFINSLTKAGKLGTAVKLFNSMWEKGHPPDVAICNCIIDALCFKKKIPDALVIFREMNEKGCEPDTATYNSLIKHICKIRRMDEAYKLLDEMEQKGCDPNARTYNYFLKSLEEPDEVPLLLKRMEKSNCRITSDTYNLILKLFIQWGYFEGVQSIWNEMEKTGLGTDQRSYTLMVHGLYNKGSMDKAIFYFTEMISKGMIPEPRTKLLVKAIEMKRETSDNWSNSSLTSKNRT
ncbi:putative pentatricopeptide repeat-containing protein At3g15200 [Aristolochia californica]|uniref:putative pentatricopeptide repeat-containing protein At3g15200 n=1 Tax=Aristolochia californica TaxID=171875 RepID=UPI0035DB5124